MSYYLCESNVLSNYLLYLWMSIPNIKKLYCLQRSSKLSPPRGSLSPEHDHSHSRGSLPKISILNESLDMRQNSVSFRTDIRTDRLKAPLAKVTST